MCVCVSLTSKRTGSLNWFLHLQTITRLKIKVSQAAWKESVFFPAGFEYLGSCYVNVLFVNKSQDDQVDRFTEPGEKGYSVRREISFIHYFLICDSPLSHCQVMIVEHQIITHSCTSLKSQYLMCNTNMLTYNGVTVMMCNCILLYSWIPEKSNYFCATIQVT